MADIEIDIKGLEKAIAKMGRYERDGVSSVMRQAVEIGAHTAFETAHIHVPHSPGGSRYGRFTSSGKPGRLAESIEISHLETRALYPDGGVVEMEQSVSVGGVKAPYASAVEAGSGIYRESINDTFTFGYGMIKARHGKGMKWRDDLGHWHRRAEVKGQKPQRFMEKSKDEALGVLEIAAGSGRIRFDI